MEQSVNYVPVNILDILDRESGTYNRQGLDDALNGFRCSKNSDVERFLKQNAVDFAKKYQAITYLVTESGRWLLAGYYALTTKAITVNAANISKTVAKRLNRMSDFDEIHQTYTVPAFLIAQLGKNEAVAKEHSIAGSSLLQLAENTVLSARRIIAGVMVFLEANDEPKLRQFYEANGYSKFGTRETVQKNGQPHLLIQYMKLLK